MAHTLINIPKKLISSNKHDKLQLELIVFAFIIKCASDDSKFKNVSIQRTMQLLGCGYTKAKELLHEAKSNHKLFDYNPHTNCLLAKSFRRAYKEVSTDKHGRTIYSMYAIKFEKKQDYKLKDVVKELRKSLFLNAVNAVERTNQFLSNSKNKNVFFSSKGALTQKKIANITGVSRSSVSRMTKGLSNDGSIKIERTHLKLINPILNETTLAEAKKAHINVIADYTNGFIYSIVPNSYSTANRDVTKRFSNIIYNHSKRYTNNPSKGMSKIDLYYERFVD